MTDFLDRWAAESPENARLVAQERLITQVTEALWKEMEEAGVDKADLDVSLFFPKPLDVP